MSLLPPGAARNHSSCRSIYFGDWSAADRGEPKAPLLHRFHQLLINEIECFGADA
jgi:hypothetical protein